MKLYYITEHIFLIYLLINQYFLVSLYFILRDALYNTYQRLWRTFLFYIFFIIYKNIIYMYLMWVSIIDLGLGFSTDCGSNKMSIDIEG
jgi:hypothetical protein